MRSGLYDDLIRHRLLIPHEEVLLSKHHRTPWQRTIKPERIPFISYPYEWSFSQLKDAALLTLEIQRIAMEYNMTLKDASAFNIQFSSGRPVLIDTLSFDFFEPRLPWIPYRQFCMHFLAPLALSAYGDPRLISLSALHLDGLPLELTSALLPIHTYVRTGLLTHIHLHARSQASTYQSTTWKFASRPMFNLHAHYGLLDSLTRTTEGLKPPTANTSWGNYQEMTSYSNESFQHKVTIIEHKLQSQKFRTVWDLGANDGFFSRLASNHADFILSLDNDPTAVDRNYRTIRPGHLSNILPLRIDLTNPTPTLGWQSSERMSLIDRGKPDALLALALIHHLVFSHNLPFSYVADFFAKLSPNLIIEFVPKHDKQVQSMLTVRKDIFPWYTENNFRTVFSGRYQTIKRQPIKNSLRSIYIMSRK